MKVFLYIATLMGMTLAGLTAATPAMAVTTVPFHATFVETHHEPCAVGTSCGTANISGLGHVEDQHVVFNACGPGCHLRTINFDDGSTIVIRESVLGPFESPGKSEGGSGEGNPRSLQITQEIVDGTGVFEGVTGSATGTVHVAANVAIIRTSGSLTYP